MVLGKKVTIFDWEWGRNSAPRDGQKRPCISNTGTTNVCNKYQNLMSWLKLIRYQNCIFLLQICSLHFRAQN